MVMIVPDVSQTLRYYHGNCVIYCEKLDFDLKTHGNINEWCDHGISRITPFKVSMIRN